MLRYLLLIVCPQKASNVYQQNQSQLFELLLELLRCGSLLFPWAEELVELLVFGLLTIIYGVEM